MGKRRKIAVIVALSASMTFIGSSAAGADALHPNLSDAPGSTSDAPPLGAASADEAAAADRGQPVLPPVPDAASLPSCASVTPKAGTVVCAPTDLSASRAALKSMGKASATSKASSPQQEAVASGAANSLPATDPKFKAAVESRIVV